MIKTILLAIDFSNITERAERYAMDIAKSVGAKVTLIHAIEPIDEANDAVQGFLESRRETAAKRAEEVAERFRQAGVDCDIKVDIGKRWKAVVDASSDGKYDLVILGSHKIHDGDKVYLGTTTHKVFFASDAPLLVVPSN